MVFQQSWRTVKTETRFAATKKKDVETVVIILDVAFNSGACFYVQKEWYDNSSSTELVLDKFY